MKKISPRLKVLNVTDINAISIKAERERIRERESCTNGIRLYFGRSWMCIPFLQERLGCASSCTCVWVEHTLLFSYGDCYGCIQLFWLFFCVYRLRPFSQLLSRYLMRSREISVGRAARNHNVDVDLTLEVITHQLLKVSDTKRNSWKIGLLGRYIW